MSTSVTTSALTYAIIYLSTSVTSGRTLSQDILSTETCMLHVRLRDYGLLPVWPTLLHTVSITGVTYGGALFVCSCVWTVISNLVILAGHALGYMSLLV